MKFLDLVKMTLAEADMDESELNDTRIGPSTLENHRFVIRVIQRNYRQIQRKIPYWDFL